MADPGDMQRLREALAAWACARRQGINVNVFDKQASDQILAVLAEEGWVVPQGPDGTSRSVTDRSTPVEEPLATPQAENEALRSCVKRLADGFYTMLPYRPIWRRNHTMPEDEEPMTAGEQSVMGSIE